MIIFSEKIAFIHVPRTAGTSITQLLKRYFNALGEPEHLDLYKKNMSEKGYSQKFIENVVSNKKHKANIMNYKYAKHSTAQYYFQIYGKEIFDSFYKFSVVRNPWDRMISWFMHTPAGRSFEEDEFIEWLRLKKMDNQIKYLKNDGEIVVDKICRYENLKRDLTDVFKSMGIPKSEISNLPVINKANHGPYRQYYSNTSRELVNGMFSEEIETFKYNF